MPRARRVEFTFVALVPSTAQGRGISLVLTLLVAANVKDHGTSPWHLSTLRAKAVAYEVLIAALRQILAAKLLAASSKRRGTED